MEDWITTTILLSRLNDFENEAAWNDVVERFRKPIVRFAQGLGLSDAAAEDVAQETLMAFAKGYRAGKYDRSKGRLSKWLFGIAYRQARSAKRARGRDARKGATPEQTDFWAAVPDEAAATKTWDGEWERAMLERCIQRVKRELAGKTFDAFDLVVRRGYTPEQAAEVLDCSRSAIYTSKHRVLKRIRELREELENVGGA